MWLIPSLKYICFRKLRLTQPRLFHTARLVFVCLFNPIFVISCILVVPRDSNAIRTAPHKALCQYTATITLPASMDFTIWLHSSDLLLLQLRTIFISSVKSYSGSLTIHTHPDQARHGTTHHENPKTIWGCRYLSHNSSDHCTDGSHLHTGCILWTAHKPLWTALYLSTTAMFSNISYSSSWLKLILKTQADPWATH